MVNRPFLSMFIRFLALSVNFGVPNGVLADGCTRTCGEQGNHCRLHVMSELHLLVGRDRTVHYGLPAPRKPLQSTAKTRHGTRVRGTASS